jgi:hypothetical protein
VKPLSTPADKKKAAGLVVGCVLVFLFVVKNVMGAMNGTAPPPETVSISGSGGNTPSTPGTGGTVVISSSTPLPGQTKDELIDAPIFTLAETPNPFHKASGALFDLGAANRPAPPQREPTPVRRSQRTRADAKFSEPFDPNGSLPAPGGQSGVIAVRPDADALEVMGRITGAKSEAVIRVGSHDYAVDKGEWFGPGNLYRLKDVTDSQVVIEHGGELHILRVGVHPPTTPPPSSTSKTPPANTPPLPSDKKTAGIS